MEQQFYQPLSAALHTPLQTNHNSQPHYPSYASHATSSAPANGAPHTTQHSQHREEEEEEEDDEEAAEEDADHRDQQSSVHSPRVSVVHPSKSAGHTLSTAVPQYAVQPQPKVQEDDTAQDQNSLDDSKRKPGRPRGSRNRKPRASTSTAGKAPAGSQHPGFYQYPPAPGGSVPNQHFYDFQWRALNLCTEFYQAAEELIKSASPIVIAQCYHAGPATKVDPLALIADAKRVCDTLLANPSQLAGQPPPAAPPAYTPIPTYGTMAPPSATSASAPPSAASTVNGPQSFVIPLGATPMAPPPGYPPQPYYTATYPPPAGSRYPTAPYYYNAPQHPGPYYAPPVAQGTPAPASAATTVSAPPPPTGAATVVPSPTPAPVQPPAESTAPAPAPTHTPVSATTSAPAPAAQPSTSTTASTTAAPAPSPASGLSAFNAATGTAAPGGTQGAWTEEETDRLKRLSEQSKEMSSNGEVEWDWVVQQWGNTRTRHQILLKATSLGLKESTTRGTKRRREPDATPDANARQLPPPQHTQAPLAQSTHSQPSHTPQQRPQHPPATHSQQTTFVQPTSVNVTTASPAQSSAASNPPSAQASPATQPMRPPSSSIQHTMNPPRTASQPSTTYTHAWPMPTIASSSSPILTHSQTHGQAHTQADSSRSNYYRPPQPPYGTTAQSPTTQAARPPSSHSMQQSTHQYMYRPLQNGGSMGRRENGM